MAHSSIPAVLRERASLQPNETAFTYVDYDQDWKGVPLTLSWSQLYRRVVNLGEQIKLRGSTGDRALILAPQGLDYIVSFLGAVQAGLVAVPLSVPNSRIHHERTLSVLADASPAVVLTTSAVIDNVSASLQPRPGQILPSIIEVDLLDLDFRRPAAGPRTRGGTNDQADFTHLQYTSGLDPFAGRASWSPTRTSWPTSSRCETTTSRPRGGPAGDTTLVSWLPVYHDMGLLLGITGAT